MLPPETKLSPEDWARLIGYAMGVSWALFFGLLTPSNYQGVISQVIVHIWSGFVGIGALLAIFGVVTRRDVKAELSGIYLIAIGGLLYFIAQLGFAFGPEFQNRIPLFVFILWHLSLLLPRLVGLEVFRRRVHSVHSKLNEANP